MPTTTQRPSRARKPAAAPAYSPAAVRLIEQIQSEAREALLNELSAKDSIIVLHGFDPATKRVRMHGNEINVRDGKRNDITLFRRHVLPESWRDSPEMINQWHPSKWYGDQTFVDASGADWSRNLGLFVCDDFGNLVKVSE